MSAPHFLGFPYASLSFQQFNIHAQPLILINSLIILRIVSGRFDTSGSMIACSVPEIHCTHEENEEEELGILVVGRVF